MAIKKKRCIASVLALLLLSQAQAQERTLAKYEYWIDNIETLFTSGNLNGQSQQTLQLAIDPEGCNEGLHHFYCRFQDSEGNWSTPLAWPFIVRALPQNEEVKVVKAEYWIDSNEKKELAVNGSQVAFTLEAAEVSEGLHTLNYRLLNNEGRYSPLYTWMFMREKLRDESIDNKAAALEYWIDDISNGVETIEADGNDISFVVDASKYSLGLHSLNYRVKDVIGRYSMPKTWMFLREELRDESIDNKVSNVEYWIDDIGNGVNDVTVSNGEINLSIDASSLNYGLHKLVYRLKDLRGRYSTPKTWVFLKNKPEGNAKVTWYKYWWDDREDMAVTEDVEAEGNTFVFEKQLTVPDYIMSKASDNETLTATFHIMFGDDAGRISGIESTDVNYTKVVRIFMVEPNDLLALKNLYKLFNGENWTAKQWTFRDMDKDMEATDFPGVVFTEPDDLGYSHVKEISLEENNLSGNVSEWTLHFPSLTALNISRNNLSGDITTFVSDLGNMKYLDISHNRISGLTSLPASVTSLNKGQQFEACTDEEIAKLSPVNFFVSTEQAVNLPTVMTYSLAKNKPVPTTLYIMERDNRQSSAYYATLSGKSDEEMLYTTLWATSPYVYEYEQAHKVYLRTSDGTVYPAVMTYVEGDANMSGATDVLDVQTTISSVFTPSLIALFGKSAANTYPDQAINVQDVVCTVNIILDNDITPELTAARNAARRAAEIPGTESRRLYTYGDGLWLDSDSEVGAMEVSLAGTTTDEVSLKLTRKGFQMASRNTADGTRHVIFSPSGKPIPAGTTQILRLSSNDAAIVDAMLSSMDAKALSVTFASTPTAIEAHSVATLKATLGDNALNLYASAALDNVEISITAANGITMMHKKLERIEAGSTIVECNIASGVYVLNIRQNGKQIANNKLVKK